MADGIGGGVARARWLRSVAERAREAASRVRRVRNTPQDLFRYFVSKAKQNSQKVFRPCGRRKLQRGGEKIIGNIKPFRRDFKTSRIRIIIRTNSRKNKYR